MLDPTIGIKIAKQKIAKVHSMVQREALGHLLGLIEDQQREIEYLREHLGYSKGE